MEFGNVDVNVRKKQGNLGVARAIYEYTKLGYVVLTPFSDSEKYDLVIDDGVSLKKVQCKTSRCKGKFGGWCFNLATRGGNTKVHTIRTRQEGDYDLLFALADDGRCWSIPTSEMTQANEIRLGSPATIHLNKFQMSVVPIGEL